MKKYILFLATIFALCSCQNKTEENPGKAQIVSIQDFVGKTLELKDLGCNVQTVRLHTDTAGYIGDIKDICRVDSFLYILDGATLSVSKFNQDGLLLRQISTQGNGPMELYTTHGIVCRQKPRVFVGFARYVYHLIQPRLKGGRRNNAFFPLLRIHPDRERFLVL